MNRESVLTELTDNRKVLLPLPDGSLEHLCYPSGEWSPLLWPWLREAGITTATTCEDGLNDSTTNTLALKRFLDGQNISVVEFDAALSGFSDWLRLVRR